MIDYMGWTARLKDTFTENGRLPTGFVEVLAGEETYANALGDLVEAHAILLDSFQSFWIETMHRALNAWPSRPASARTKYYGAVLRDHIVQFRSLRGAEVLLYQGYPMDGVALLRDSLEQALLLAAIANGVKTYRAIHGLDAIARRRESLGDAEAGHTFYTKLRNARQLEQREALDSIIGKKCGLSKSNKAVLDRWRDFFDLEVHGSRLTGLESENAISPGGPLVLAPRVEERSVRFYVNRCEAACWLWTRLLPLLQVGPGSFGAQWAECWQLLNDSFRFRINHLTALNSPIGPAVTELAEAKFAFNAQSCYVE